MRKNKLMGVILTAVILSPIQGLALSPDSVKVKVEAMYASTSEYCTDMVVVFSNDSADYIDFTAGGQISDQGALADGTYKCIAFKISDNIKFTPANAEGSCTVQEYTIDVCSDGGGNGYTDAAFTCSASEDSITFYVSTVSSRTDGGDSGNPMVKPTAADTANGFTLDGALVVSGKSTGQFIVNFSEKVTSSGSCGLDAPSMGFL